MKFQIFQPSKELQLIVQCYMEIDGRASLSPGEYMLCPNGLSGMFFNFGNTEKIIIKEAYQTPSVSVYGQIDRHFMITHRPGFYSLGVLLKPSVLSRLFKLDMQEFTNKTFDGQLIRNDLVELHHQLAETRLVKEKIQCVEQYLSRLFERTMCPLTFVDHAIQLIHQQKTTSIDQLARSLQISQRHLEIQFKRTVGLSPKTYSLIQRFKRMEQQLVTMPTVHWEHMSFASEYYDQNHFIRDFKRFTGLTPSAYLLGNVAMSRSYLSAR